MCKEIQSGKAEFAASVSKRGGTVVLSEFLLEIPFAREALAAVMYLLRLRRRGLVQGRLWHHGHHGEQPEKAEGSAVCISDKARKFVRF